MPGTPESNIRLSSGHRVYLAPEPSLNRQLFSTPRSRSSLGPPQYRPRADGYKRGEEEKQVAALIRDGLPNRYSFANRELDREAAG